MQFMRSQDTLCCACLRVDVRYRALFAALGHDPRGVAMDYVRDAATLFQLHKRHRLLIAFCKFSTEGRPLGVLPIYVAAVEVCYPWAHHAYWQACVELISFTRNTSSDSCCLTAFFIAVLAFAQRCKIRPPTQLLRTLDTLCFTRLRVDICHMF